MIAILAAADPLSIVRLFNFSTKSLTHLLDVWGYPLVAIFVAIESTGIPFPGETMLVTAAVYAGTGHLAINWVIFAAALGAIVGDNFGYLAGRQGGRRLVIRFGPYLRITPQHLDTAESFFERHGDKTVFFGRHLAVLRAWAAFLAGMNRMAWQKFLLYNAAGGILWALLYGILGFALGNHLPLLHRVLSVLEITGAIVTLLLAVVILMILRKRRSTQNAEVR